MPNGFWVMLTHPELMENLEGNPPSTTSDGLISGQIGHDTSIHAPTLVWTFRYLCKVYQNIDILYLIRLTIYTLFESCY